jgi:hypothetical protein
VFRNAPSEQKAINVNGFGTECIDDGVQPAAGSCDISTVDIRELFAEVSVDRRLGFLPPEEF